MTGHNRIPTKSSFLSDEQFIAEVASWIPCAFIGVASFALLMVLA